MPAPHARPPLWFSWAVSVRPEERRTTVQGCEIAWLRWTGEGRRTVVLVHGGGANARWWSFLAPLLLPACDVVAVDLSGHGDSGWRERYTFDRWTAEVLAVARASRGARPSVLVGHSLSGITAALAAAFCGDELAGAVLVDTPLHRPQPADIGNAEDIFSAPKRYATEAEARRRFRALPPQPVEHPALTEHVAAASARRYHDGWGWKFDPRAFAVPPVDRPPDVGAVLSRATCPITAIVGERSPIVPEDQRRRLRALETGGDAPVTLLEVPDGWHHLMFDQPIPLAGAIGAVVRRWEREAPSTS